MPANAKLKTIYEKAEDIPEGYGDLYAEKNGKFELTGIEGVKTPADVARYEEALRKERADHKAAKDKLSKFGEVDPDSLPALIEELNEAKAKLDVLTAEGKVDEQKVTERVNAAVQTAVGPVQRDKQALERKLEAAQRAVVEKEKEVERVREEQKSERIKQRIRDAVIEAKVLPSAVDDAVLVGKDMFDFTDDGRLITKNDIGVTPGLDPKEWAKDMFERKPHWWPASVGGGSRGGGGPSLSARDNPWSAEAWNITAQGQFLKQNGAAKAAEMAARVGARLGQTKPPAAARAA